MKLLVLLIVGVVCGALADPADVCTSENCALEDGCVCADGNSPISPASDIPQLVLLSFDDAARADLMENYYEPLLSNRKNPDGQKVGATFFVPHEYSNYAIVNQLYNQGHEIGVHSITKREADYWATAELEVLVSEMRGQKMIINKHANVPNEDIRGARIPQLQLSGDKSFEAYKESEITYDSTWTTLSKNPLFPYNLKFLSGQQCLIGTCPQESYPDIWVVPTNNIKGEEDIECNSLFGCLITGTPEDVSEWLTSQFNEHYLKHRAPFNLLINFSWLSNEDNYKGLQLFLDSLQSHNDVFLVTEWEAIQWRRNPVTAANYKTSRPTRNAKCSNTLCELKKGEELRYMYTCTDCPKVFPWVDNPEGKLI